jgi:hypothetical protein
VSDLLTCPVVGKKHSASSQIKDPQGPHPLAHQQLEQHCFLDLLLPLVMELHLVPAAGSVWGSGHEWTAHELLLILL